MDDGSNVPPHLQYDVILQGRASDSGAKEFKWWDRNVDPALFALMLPRGQFIYGRSIVISKKKDYYFQESGKKLRLKPGEEFNTEKRAVCEANGEEVDLGEGQEAIDEQSERRRFRRDNISRAQAFRYFMHHHGPKTSMNDPHWLFDWRDLAQLMVITFNNRMVAEKVHWLKKVQDRIRLVRVKALREMAEKILRGQGIESKIFRIIIFKQ